MHILFFTDNFLPEVNAPASRTYEHCREWVQAGHEVTIITCAPNFPTGKVFEGYKNKLYQSEMMDGIKVIRVWSYMAANEGFLWRVLDYTSFMITSFFAALFVSKVDVIIGTSPQFFCACGAWAASFFKWKPFIFELRDLWPESIRAVGAMEKSKLLDILEWIELFLYRRAKLIFSVTYSFKKNLIDRGIDGEKIDVITNSADLSRYSPRDKDSDLVKELGLEGKFVAGYIGTHGMAHGLDALHGVAAKLQEEGHNDIVLLFLGDGALKDGLMAHAKAEGLDNVLHLKSVSKDQVARYWSLLDLSIIHLKRNDTFKTVIPSKMFECMAMGIPILHCVEGESADMIRIDEVGLTAIPEDIDDISEKILTLYKDQKFLRSLKRNGIVAAKKYDRKAMAKDMLYLLTSSFEDNEKELNTA